MSGENFYGCLIDGLALFGHSREGAWPGMPLCQGLPRGPCPAGRNDSSVRNGEGDLMLCPDCDRERHLEFLANRPARAVPLVSAASSGSVGTTTSTVATRSSAKQCTTRQTDSSKTVNKPEICKSVTVISAVKNDAIDRAEKLFVMKYWHISLATETGQAAMPYVASFLNIFLRKTLVRQRNCCVMSSMAN